MDIFKKALSLELDGEKVLRQLADQTSSSGLRRIFLLLADDEMGHQEILRNLQNGKNDEVNSQGINKASNIFVSLVGDEEEVKKIQKNLSLYSDLQAMEKDAEELYSNGALKTENSFHREIFYKLAEEEQRHGILIENIIEIVNRAPQAA